LQSGVSLDAYLLLGKLSYACGNYEDALENFKKADLDNLAEKALPCRSVKIVAESFAIKGLVPSKANAFIASDTIPYLYKILIWSDL
jgi:tetratricopeptide repeat protein 7